MVAYTYNFSTQEADAGRSLHVQGQPEIQNRLQASVGWSCYAPLPDNVWIQAQAALLTSSSAPRAWHLSLIPGVWPVPCLLSPTQALLKPCSSTIKESPSQIICM